MATSRQRLAASKNVERAQARRRGMTSGHRALGQPRGRVRRQPGAGGGRYYRVAVRPKSEFVSFRTQDVGRKGHIQRVAGRRSSGSWATVTWLIGKVDAHVLNGHLVPDTLDARKLIAQLGSRPVHTTGDRFTASDRRNIPEKEKPTAAQRRARKANIKKAHAARRKRT